MTFIEFKKYLLDIEMSLPKFCELIKVSDKNIQSYKKKGQVPNTIAVIVASFVALKEQGIDFKDIVESLQLEKKTKDGGFKKKKVTKAKSLGN
ncbi:MAG: hypothetical protein C0603_06750 [Denitrovibrio sp.]|nr:MAG: hypothetical protein C0603_06750 [Denitrovibrio sp.]